MRAFIQRPRLSLIVVSAFTAVMLSQVLPAWWEDQPVTSAIGQSVPGNVFEGQITSIGKDRFTMLTGGSSTGVAASQIFLIPPNTPITMNGRPAQLSDLKPGSFVRVTGTQMADGTIVADAVDVCAAAAGAGAGARQAANVIFVGGGGGGGGGGFPGVLPPGVIPPVIVPPGVIPPTLIPPVVIPPTVVVPPVAGLPNLPQLPTLPTAPVLPGLPTLPTLPGVPPVGCINCPKPIPRELIGGTIEAVVQVEADLKAQAGEQVQIATGIVDQLLNGDCNIHDVANILAPKLQHLCNVLQSTIGTANDTTTQAKAELVTALQALTNTLKDCGSNVPQTVERAKAVLADKLNTAATAADRLVAATKDKADSAVSALATCLHGAADSAKELTQNVADKVIEKETKLAQALLGTISPCNGLVSDVVGKVDAKKALIAQTLHRTADFVEATLGRAGDKVQDVKQLVASLHDCGNALEVAIAAAKDKVGDARQQLAGKLDALSDAVRNFCGGDGVPIDGAKGLLIEKTHQAAVAVRELVSATGDKVASIENRLSHALHDIGNSCGVIVPELIGKVGDLKHEVAGLLSGQTELSQDLRATVTQLLRADVDLDVTLSRQLCDAILAGAALDADVRGQLAQLVAVDIDLDALTDASLVHGLASNGEINAAVLARLAPVLFTDGNLDAVFKINLARMLRGDVQPGLALGADVHSQLLGLLLDKIDQDCGPVATLAVLLRSTANSVEQAIDAAPETVAQAKADLIAKLRNAAGDCDNLVATIKSKLGDTTDDAKQAIANAHAKLANTLNDVLTSCTHLGELVQDTKREAVLLIAASLHSVRDAAQGLVGATGDKLHAAEQKLYRVIEDARFRVGLLIFMTNERIATLESHLCSKLNELADAIQRTITNADDAVGAAKTRLVQKLRMAANAARELATALKMKADHVVTTTEETVKAKVAALAEKLDDAVGSCHDLVATLKGKVGEAETKLATTLENVAQATHELANGAADKVAALESKLCDCLQNALEETHELVSDLKGTAQDTTARLGHKLREAAALLKMIVDEKKDTIADAKAHAIEKLLAAADAADALADCLKESVDPTVADVKQTVEQAQAKLAETLADASCACGLLAMVTQTAQTAVTAVEHKLAWTLATASGAVHGLIGATEDKLATIEDALADSLSCACHDINRLIALLPATPGQLPSQLLPAVQAGAELDAQARGELARFVLAQLELDAEARAALTRQLLATAELDGDAQAKLASILQAQTVATARIETLLHGPIHEAFMHPFSANTAVGEMVTTMPPAPLVEKVPQLAQHGDGLQFIKGYWSTDPETHQFVWVTGTLRNAPPGHTWMASVWEKVDGGFRRTPGAWVPNGFDLQKATVPVPPVAKQVGPIGNAPSPNHVWFPGHWSHNNGQFLWKPGFWGQGNNNWVWTAPHYVQTADGAVFINGFWDRPITQRGVLFAPLQVHNMDSLHSATEVTPNVIVNTSRMMLHLFVAPDRQHYLFGNFHAAEFASAGIRPWFEKTGMGQDPLLNFHARQMTGVDLMARLQSWHRYFQNNPSACPPRTLADFASFVQRNANNPHAMASLVVANLNDPPAGNASQIVMTSGSQQLGVVPASNIPGVGLTNFGFTGTGSNIPGAGFTGVSNLPSVNGLGGVGGMGLPGVGGVGASGMSLPGVGGIGGGGLGLPGVGGVGGGGLPGVGGIGGAGGLPGVGGLGLPGGGVGLGGVPKP